MGVAREAGRTGSLASQSKKTRIQQPAPHRVLQPPQNKASPSSAVTSARHQLSLVRGTHKMHKGKSEPIQTDEGQLSGVVFLLTTSQFFCSIIPSSDCDPSPSTLSLMGASCPTGIPAEHSTATCLECGGNAEAAPLCWPEQMNVRIKQVPTKVMQPLKLGRIPFPR